MYIHLVIEDLCALYLLGCSLVTYPIFKACAQAQAHLLLEWSGENRNWFTRRYLPFCYWICRRWFQILHWGLGVHVACVADPPWLVGRPLLLASMHLQSTSRLCLFQYTPFWITVCHMLSWLLKWLIKAQQCAWDHMVYGMLHLVKFRWRWFFLVIFCSCRIPEFSCKFRQLIWELKYATKYFKSIRSNSNNEKWRDVCVLKNDSALEQWRSICILQLIFWEGYALEYAGS